MRGGGDTDLLGGDTDALFSLVVVDGSCFLNGGISGICIG